MSTSLFAGDIVNDRYKIVATIGQGRFGMVYSAHDTAEKENQLVAIKKVLFINEKSKAVYEIEANIMEDLDNPNVIRMFDSFTKDNRGYIIMELARCDLIKILIKCPENRFNENCIMYVTYSVCGGLAYLHSKRIIFIDLKPENVLIMPNGDVKLSDFGLAQRMNDDGKPKNPKWAGTYDYMAPEMISLRLKKSIEYDVKVDIFSFGSLVIGMLISETPNQRVWQINGNKNLMALTEQEDFFEIVKDEIDKLNFKIENGAVKLVRKCLSKRPEDRPTAKYCYEFLRENLPPQIESHAEEIAGIAKDICEEPQEDFFGILAVEQNDPELNIGNEATGLDEKCLSKKPEDRPAAAKCCKVQSENFSSSHGNEMDDLKPDGSASKLADLDKLNSSKVAHLPVSVSAKCGSEIPVQNSSLRLSSSKNDSNSSASTRQHSHCALKNLLVWIVAILLCTSIFFAEIGYDFSVLEFSRAVHLWLVILLKYFMFMLLALLGLWVFWNRL